MGSFNVVIAVAITAVQPTLIPAFFTQAFFGRRW